ncbi:MAG: hypothetical protein C0623_12865 [Desulfuromonas sp.]|nr:MAG: hypothetical protein C0623_12865 [Desulfuromonas sp.]
MKYLPKRGRGKRRDCFALTCLSVSCGATSKCENSAEYLRARCEGTDNLVAGPAAQSLDIAPFLLPTAALRPVSVVAPQV